MNIQNVGINTGNTSTPSNTNALVKPQSNEIVTKTDDKFEPWVKKPEIHGAKDYFKNIGASVGNGAVGFGIVGGGKVIVATGMDGKPTTKLGAFLKSALIVGTMAGGAVVGAGVGLVMGLAGRNAGELIDAKNMRK